MRLIIDTDPGVDDAIAILLAMAAPEVEVVGLTTLGGNVPRARATRNALALLQAAGHPDIPVPPERRGLGPWKIARAGSGRQRPFTGRAACRSASRNQQRRLSQRPPWSSCAGRLPGIRGR